ncbi:AfsR family transcriptional regulator [Streptomyces albofaciens JCM 4342]|uniref:AfsR/SARP family transcriptional regulator n=1 Tax=Streptomyces albofaciens TaxID=66866 RepID=UPI00123C7363|nr:BTAD domain-containing putative transcriptional regulator [Streptomyces albofaciens]KAA6223613.1 AfsR family transcriptional regulator [Streptomyces albofaciens JCM 4342]
MADAAGDERQLWFTVLGAVAVRRGEQELDAGSPRQRALLAVLLLQGGRGISAVELIRALWGENPPPAAMDALREYVCRLREVLAPDADMLVSESDGYALRVDEGGLDLRRAERLASEAEQARRTGDPARARELLVRALELWTGEPLAGVPGPYAATWRNRLEERRLSLVETRIALDLEAGRHAEAVAELTALTAEHPLRERLRELLMLALYRGNRRAEALAAYADIRRLLGKREGVAPSARLSELHRRILRTDPRLPVPEGGRPGPAGGGAARGRPAQLPLDTPDFTGRAALVEELVVHLGPAQGRGVALCAVGGTGGVGKTALAVHVAHAVRPFFPDGQLYVDLQGCGPRPADPETVLGAFLRALGVSDCAIPEGVGERAALYRSVLDGCRVLVLLDNARDAAQVRPLLPGTDGCAALITSRNRLAHLPGTHVMALDVMRTREALALFTRITGEGGEDARAVVAACGCLPLAIRIAAARLVARRAWTAADLVRKLADEHRRLQELQAGDLGIKATFELGYGQLPAPQARAFRLVALPCGLDISLGAAAAVLGLGTEEARRTLEFLVDTSLLESPAPDRYRYHDLVRLYARACAERDEPPERCAAARSRLLDHYLATAARVYTMNRPGEPLLDHLEPTRYPGLAFDDRESALEWLYTEAGNLLACARASAGGSMLRRAADLLLVTKDLADSGTGARQYEQTVVRLLTAALAARDARAEGRLRLLMIHLHVMAGRLAEADREARAAMALRRHCADPVLSSHALNESGIIAGLQGRHDDAEALLTQALAAYRSYGNHNSAASVLGNLARTYQDTGRITEGVDLAEQCLALYREIGATVRLATGHYELGVALKQAGRPEDALRHLGRAVAIYQDSRQCLWEAMTYWRMAEAHLAAGRPAQAAGRAEEALAILHGPSGRWARANALTVLGHALRRTGHADRARVCWQEALETYEELGSPEAPAVRRLLPADGTAPPAHDADG